MTGWTHEQLAALGGAGEIRIATLRADGTARTALPIWVVRVGDELYVRSFHGPDGTWFHQVTRHPFARVRAAGTDVVARLVPVDDATAAVDEAYRTKYGRTGHGATMTTPADAATTLRLDPVDAS
jgi:hypothetical protein